MKKSLLCVMALCLVSGAQAGLLELRVGAGLLSNNPKDFERKVEASAESRLSATEFGTLNVDAILNIPLFPLNVGVRYERSSQDKSGAGASWDVKWENIALLADFRFIDTFVYVGPIVTVGRPSARLDYADAGTSFSKKNLSHDNLSYSAGLGGGVRLGRFLAGAEAGYQSIRFKPAAGTALDAKLDLSGMYGKILVGVTFL